MDGLLGDEERELRFLVAEHCLDAFPPTSNKPGEKPTSYVSNPSSQPQNELAHAIALVLAQTGWSSLLDVNEALTENRFSTPLPQNMLTEDNLRTEVKRMMTHGIVRYDSRNGRYSLDILFGVLRILFPLMASVAISKGGAVCETALQILYEHHDLPINVLTNLVYDANPQLGQAAVDRVLQALQSEEFIIQVSSTTGTSNNSASKRDVSVKSDNKATNKTDAAAEASGSSKSVLGGGGAKSAIAAALSSSSASANNSGLNASFGINYAKFLAAYRSDLLIKYATENLNSKQRGIVHLLAQSRVKETRLETASHADENPAPKLPHFGQEIPIDKIVQRLAQTQQASEDHAHALVRSLTNDGLRPLVQVMEQRNGNNSNSSNSNTGGGGTQVTNINDLFGGSNNSTTNQFHQSAVSSSSSSSSTIRLNYDNAMERIRRALMCAEVRARFGLLGQRIVKILFEHHAMEDKNIAEEGLISLQDLHQLLLAMQSQGILGLQELMKLPSGGVSVSVQIAANSGPDRNMKQSIFLWRLLSRNLLSLVRRRVAKSICALRVRMRAELAGLKSTDATATTANNNSSNDEFQSPTTGPRAPDNTAASRNNNSTNATIGVGSRQRLGIIQQHMSRSLVALYEELCLSVFC